MKIEKLGVRITDVPLLQNVIITPEHIEINGKSFAGAEVQEMRDALTEALTAYTELSATFGNPPATGFFIGQELTGDEQLPVGTVVVDKDNDLWTFRGDLWESADDDTVSVNHWPGTVERYAPVTIMSLPGGAQ